MAIQYLLPCSACGKKHPVETGRAGDQLQCDCGATVDIPTMRELRLLEVQEAASAEPGSAAAGRASSGRWGDADERGESTWAPWQGVLLAGIVILLAGLIPAGAFLAKYPQRPKADMKVFEEFTDTAIEKMTLYNSWQYWRDLCEEGHVLPPSEKLLAYEKDVAEMNQRLGICIGVASAGLLAIVIAAMLRMSAVRRPAKAAPPAP